MIIFHFIYVLCAVILFATIHCDKSIEDDMQICEKLCSSCNGIKNYVNGICECQIDVKNLKLIECINDIKIKAAEKNLTLLNIPPKILERSSRCCPSNGRITTSDILRVVDYYMKGGPQAGARILENRRKLDDSLIDPVDCQYCPYNNESPDDNFPMPEEESIINQSPVYPSMQTACREQAHYPVQNSYTRDDYNIPNIPTFHQILSPINYHHLLLNFAPCPDYPHDQLSPLLSPVHQYNPYKSIKSQFTHLPAYNYPQPSSGQNPYHNYEKSITSGLFHNHIMNPSCLCPPIMQSRCSGIRSCQQCPLEVPIRRKPIVQPSYTLPTTTMWPLGRRTSIIKSPLQSISRIANTPIRNQQSTSYTDFVTEINYPGEQLLGAANPNAQNGDNNNYNNGRDIPDVRGQQIVIDNRDRNPMPSIRSDITVKPDLSTMPSQTQMSPTDENPFLMSIPNTMKRTIPALLRYKKIKRR